jgi:hypothetical protein
MANHDKLGDLKFLDFLCKFNVRRQPQIGDDVRQAKSNDLGQTRLDKTDILVEQLASQRLKAAESLVTREYMFFRGVFEVDDVVLV